MADITVLTGNNSNEWTLVLHFPVPDVNNSAGINFRTALVSSGIGKQEGGRRTVLPPGNGIGGTISTAEEAQLDAGERFEHVKSFRAESGGTSNAQLRSSFRGCYASENVKVQANMASRLRYFGHTESAT